MSHCEHPSRDYREWLRHYAWPFRKREREGSDSVLPHLEEFFEQSRLVTKRQESKGRKPASDRLNYHMEKAPH